jgi:hypothetical protein
MCCFLSCDDNELVAAVVAVFIACGMEKGTVFGTCCSYRNQNAALIITFAPCVGFVQLNKMSSNSYPKNI